jgi:hypothetical protein
MRPSLRCQLIPLIALALYSLVHVLGPALHRHEVKASQAGAHAALGVASVPADSSAYDDDDACIFCGILHLAQVPPVIFETGPAACLSCAACLAFAIVRPNPIERTTHSRGPPAL